MSTARLGYEVFRRGRLFVVRWRLPTVEGGRALASLIEDQRQVAGAPLFVAVLIGPDCPPPSPEAREVLLRGHDRIHELTEAVHVVIIAGSVRQTVMRSVVTAMTLAANLRGKPFSVDKTVTALMRSAAKVVGGEPDELVRALLDAGLVSEDEAKQ